MLAVPLQCLIVYNTTTEVASDCQRLLKQFVHDSVGFYGSGFVSYNMHSLINLVDDFRMFGSLDTVNCFAFESFLGRLKSSLHSTHKSFRQICQRDVCENENSLISAKLGHHQTEYGFMKRKSHQTCQPTQTSFAKIVLHDGCVIKRQSLADSTVRLHQALYYVHDII